MPGRGNRRGSGRARGGVRGGHSSGFGRGAPQSSLRPPGRGQNNDNKDEVRESTPVAPVVVSFTRKTPSELQQLKLKLLNTVSASLIKEPRFDSANSIAYAITHLVKEIAFYDPEFVLKLALYTREDLV